MGELALPKQISAVCEPIASLTKPNLAPLLDRIGNAQIVLLGESTHGTKEFYDLRADVTLELINKKGFEVIGLEADWPDAYGINDYVHGRCPFWRGFERFPEWMWRNASVKRFATRLRQHNQARPNRVASVYGLDLYSLTDSLRAMIRLLEADYPEFAVQAQNLADCFLPWREDPSDYGLALKNEVARGCGEEVLALLKSLHAKRVKFAAAQDPNFFSALRNAEVIRGAEAYYRSMYESHVESWNLRDTHMFKTIEALLDHHGPKSKIIIWAHNSHLGNAAATEMGDHGEINVGQLCKEAYLDGCYGVGFLSDHGTVAAADRWGGEVKFKALRAARADSCEAVFHNTGLPGFFLPLRNAEPDLKEALSEPRLERAVGVIYRPETERSSHYFSARLTEQFDEIAWLDETGAVEPLQHVRETAEPDTFPFGL